MIPTSMTEVGIKFPLVCQTTPGISDHNAVVVDISTQVKLVKKPPREIFLYHEANWDLIRERMLDIYERYFELNSTTQRSVNENWEYIYEQCSQLIQEMAMADPGWGIWGKCPPPPPPPSRNCIQDRDTPIEQSVTLIKQSQCS